MHKHRGSALLTALFMVTLVAIMATAISVRVRNDIHRTHLIAATDNLYLATQAVTLWAMDRLLDPKENLGKATAKGRVLVLPSTLANLYPNIKIAGELFDLQARFNVNNLFDERYQFVFYGLLNKMNIGSNPLERKNLMDAVSNWIQPLKEGATHDEWQDKYARQKPAYLPSHMPLAHISELRLVYGVNAKQYQQLAGVLTALPETTPVNLNTASKTLLMSLSAGIKEDDVTHILQKRHSKPFRNPQEVAPFISKYHIQEEVLTLESQYFLAVATAQFEDLTMKTYVVLRRQRNKKGIWHVSIMSQSLNTP